MAATCLVPKEKLYCKHCDMKSSHNTLACLKKKKRTKKRKRDQKREKRIKKNLLHPEKKINVGRKMKARPVQIQSRQLITNYATQQLRTVTNDGRQR